MDSKWRTKKENLSIIHTDRDEKRHTSDEGKLRSNRKLDHYWGQLELQFHRNIIQFCC